MKKLLLLLGLCTWMWGVKAEEARLLRFPHIHDNRIVFVYAGDLYQVDANGGTARKLTSHNGYEMFPRISPDGKHIAFTGQYDGNTEVFVIPVEGGEPKRLTYTATLSRDDLGDRMGPNNMVVGWTPDSKNILYRSRRYTFNDFTGQLFTVSAEGGESVELPMADGGFASYSPDGKKLAYNHIMREFRTWKRYAGGMADDIRIFDFDTKQSEKITDNPQQDIIPMWARNGKEIYYISDRDGVMNLYVYDTDSKQTAQLTFGRTYDIKFPAMGDDRIVYERGGYLYKFDVNTKKEEKVTVRIDNDQVYSRPEWKDVSYQVRNIGISPDGQRILLSARGDIFSLPAKDGITYNLTRSSDANDYAPAWSPDGKSMAYISDKDGEFHIYLRDAASGLERKLTGGIKTYIYGFDWSPDSKKIAWSEKKNTLNLLDVASGKNTVVETSGTGGFNSYAWSPDSRYITYIRPGKEVNYVMVYDTRDGEKQQITGDWYNVGNPAFSSDGKYLLFTSARTFNPTYGSTEWNHVYNNMDKIYILPLAKGAAVPFAPVNDGMAVPTETAVSGSLKAGKKGGDKEMEYDFTRLDDRMIELPVPASHYYNIAMIGQNVYYNRGGSYLFNLDTRRETQLNAYVSFGPGYKKALVSQGGRYQVMDVPTQAVNIDAPVSMDGVKKKIDYHQEWMQIYNESWRQMRDFFYAKNMHGVDWDSVYRKYKVLVPHVNHRTDLTYILGEMNGELNVGHAYSANGEHPMPARIGMGLLGAQFGKDVSGYFKVKKIIGGANWNEATRSPLTMPGVDVKEGDYILSVNGKSLKENADIFESLAGMAGKTVEMQVNTVPDAKGARTVLVVPLADESALYYYNWVEENTKKVSDATGGQVGYIHIPDMGVAGLNEFVKHYYPQLGKKALIIDDRGNGGGNVSPMITERLMRTPTFYTMHTNQAQGNVNPVGTFIGPKVLLVNEYSASDGDLFPYRFKYNKLGTVIGRRTWGGTVGYSGQVPVVDGGYIVTPSYAPYAADGSEFIIEGRGVSPDIEVDNDPYKEYMGEDEQLNKAIEIALEKLKTEAKEIPAIPPFPDKSGKK